MGAIKATANCEFLKNGAVVIARHIDIVLCKWDDQYVTWTVDDEGNAYLGHYHMNIFSAVADYGNRLKRNYIPESMKAEIDSINLSIATERGK
jgi:hypothetical protein